MLKKVNAIILGLAVLMAVGCGKDEKQGDPDIAKKNCQLIKRTISYRTFNIQHRTDEITLNNKGQIIAVLHKASDDTNPEFVLGNSVLFYNQSGQLIQKNDYYETSTQILTFDKYEYDAAGLLVKHDIYAVHNDTILGSSDSFEYYPDNRLKKHYVSPTKDSYYEYTYSGNNKVIRKTAYWDATTNQLKLQQVEEMELDSKNAPKPYTYLSFDGVSRPGQDFEHNVILNKVTNYGVGKSGTAYINYQYNSDDYPISWSTTDSLGNVGSYGTYDYNCQ